MSADATADTTLTTNTSPTAKDAPTAQAGSQAAAVPKKITNAQTVCNEKNEKGKLCNGHLKQLRTGGEEAEVHLRGDDVLFKCQTCGALYMGPPLGHVRDPEKQSRFVQKELTALLQAAGGTLPAFKKNESGAFVPVNEPTEHAHAKPAPTAAAKPAAAAPPPVPSAAVAAPAGETPEEKKARLIAEAKARKATTTSEGKPAAPPSHSPGGRTTPAAHSTSGTDSSTAADAHREAAEAQAATGQASAVPLSPAAATASPAAGAETVADLAPEASTELTPGAPKDGRDPQTTTSHEESEKPA